MLIATPGAWNRIEVIYAVSARKLEGCEVLWEFICRGWVTWVGFFVGGWDSGEE